MHSVPLAILDRANTRSADGQIIQAPQIFAEVTARARHAEQLGFHRFWVAEHHSVPGIAGSAPTLLLPTWPRQPLRCVWAPVASWYPATSRSSSQNSWGLCRAYTVSALMLDWAPQLVLPNRFVQGYGRHQMPKCTLPTTSTNLFDTWMAPQISPRIHKITGKRRCMC